MNRLKVGVVGVGHLGQHHARVLAGLPGVELVAVADSRVEQARAVAAKHGTRGVADYRELLGLVDAVSIAAPTFLHREIAGAFLTRGVATMVEKPLAATGSDAEELVDLARRHGALLQVGHIERFNPALQALDGLDLRPRYVTAERLSSYTFRSTDIGVVHDLMIHDIDLVLALVSSPVKSVAAVGVRVFGGHEDVANARVEFEDGCVANLTANRASLQAAREMRIYGPEGFVALDFTTGKGTLIHPSEQLRRGEIDLDGVDMTQAAAIQERVFGKILRVDRVEPQAAGRDQLTRELDDFAQAARGLGSPKVNGDDALRALRLADLILKSLNEHAWEAGPAVVGSLTDLPTPSGVASHTLRGPISWRLQGTRNSPVPS